MGFSVGTGPRQSGCPSDLDLLARRGTHEETLDGSTVSSATFIYETADTIKAAGRPALIFYVGDYDASGMLIPEVIERGLRTFAPEVEITFERIAVTAEQIERFALPTRPPKSNHPHSKGFNDTRTVEAEAIPAHMLRDLLREKIEAHLDRRELAVLKAAEESESDYLNRLADRVGHGE